MGANRQFGPFLLQEMLAVGGMGELYIATRVDDPPDTPPVVLKILLREYQESSEFVAMFRDEARIGMRLAHVNVVGIQDVGTVENTPYIVMEYVHGENLRAVLKACRALGERIPLELAVRIAIDAALGLDHAHRARDENGEPLKLVHRDLSPDNVMISYAGEVKILDFGIAKAEGRSTHTQMGVLKGKAQYMSPEQAMAHPVDPRSDLFALGILLYESLTGRKRLKTEEPVAQILEARTWLPLVPSEAEPSIPSELDTVVVKACQPDPDRRFQTAEEMAAVLTRILRSGILPRSRETLPALLRRLFPDRPPAWAPPVDEDISRPRRRRQPEPSPSVPEHPTSPRVSNLASEPTLVKARPGSSEILFERAETVRNAPQIKAPESVDWAPDPEVPSALDLKPAVAPPPPDDTISAPHHRAAQQPPPPSETVETVQLPAADPPEKVDTVSRTAIARIPLVERQVSATQVAAVGLPREDSKERPISESRPTLRSSQGPVVRAPVDTPMVGRPAAPPLGEISRPRRPPQAPVRRSGERHTGLTAFVLLVLVLGGAIGLGWVFRERLPAGLRSAIAWRARWVEARFFRAQGSPTPATAGMVPGATPPEASFTGDSAGRLSRASSTPAPAASGVVIVPTPRPAATPLAVASPVRPAFTPGVIAPVERMPVEGATSATVSLTSEPTGVEIRLDDAPTGRRTPATLDLPPGTHALTLEADGYRKWSWSQELRAGEARDVKATLVPLAR